MQMNIEVCWSGAVEKAGAGVEVSARAISQMPSVKSLHGGEVWKGSWVAEAVIQDDAAECARGGGEEDMPATEEGVHSEDGAVSRDSSGSSRLLCM